MPAGKRSSLTIPPGYLPMRPVQLLFETEDWLSGFKSHEESYQRVLGPLARELLAYLRLMALNDLSERKHPSSNPLRRDLAASLFIGVGRKAVREFEDEVIGEVVQELERRGTMTEPMAKNVMARFLVRRVLNYGRMSNRLCEAVFGDSRSGQEEHERMDAEKTRTLHELALGIIQRRSSPFMAALVDTVLRHLEDDWVENVCRGAYRLSITDFVEKCEKSTLALQAAHEIIERDVVNSVEELVRHVPLTEDEIFASSWAAGIVNIPLITFAVFEEVGIAGTVTFIGDLDQLPPWARSWGK